MSSTSLRRLFLPLILLSLLCGGCSSGTQVPPQNSVPIAVADYLAWGDRFARQGESTRAEQYYRAAARAGGDEDLVLSRLLETCVFAGRLGSAVHYAEERLREEPENEHLLRLSASLREALGHRKLAFSHVLELERLEAQSADTLLFLAEFHDRQKDVPERTLAAYRKYEERVPSEQRPPWVSVAVRRLTDLLEIQQQITRSAP